MVCVREGGIPAGTYVQDYLGELYTPWRWYERQDAIKKRAPGKALPDFFNITLERPKEDAAGVDDFRRSRAPVHVRVAVEPLVRA